MKSNEEIKEIVGSIVFLALLGLTVFLMLCM